MGYPEKDVLPEGALTEITKLASQIVLGWDDDELDFQSVQSRPPIKYEIRKIQFIKFNQLFHEISFLLIFAVVSLG